MDREHTKRGYALSGLMCIGSLACGPSSPSTDGGESTGYPLTGTESGTTATSGSETDSGTDTETGSEDTTTETTGPSGCSYRGDICGEMSVCQCDCDYSADCCGCEPTTCTENSHCPDGQVCRIWVEDHWTHSGCYDSACITPITLDGLNADPSEYVDFTCAWRVTITDTSLTDLSALASLTQVINEVNIVNNDALVSLDGFAIESAANLNISFNHALTDISALTSLVSLDSGEIYCNNTLDPVHVDETLAQCPAGAAIYPSSNGGGSCP